MIIDNYTKHSQYRDKQGFLHSDWRHCNQTVGEWNIQYERIRTYTPMQRQRAKIDDNYLKFCQLAISSAMRREDYYRINKQ